MRSAVRACAVARMALLCAVSLAGAASAVAAAPLAPFIPRQDAAPFGLVTFAAPDGLLWSKWRGVQADIAREERVIAACRVAPSDCAVPAAQMFISLVDAARPRTGRDRLDTVNLAVNAAIRYTADLDQHGVADRWSAPLATLGSGRGDCEDYAIAKYVVLRAAGTPRGDLRLVLVRDRWIGEDHAVLAARADDRWFILDNRWSALREDGDAGRFTPLFALDHEGVKLFAARAVPREPEFTPAAATHDIVAASPGSALPLLL